jgi:hypothetical protein
MVRAFSALLESCNEKGLFAYSEFQTHVVEVASGLSVVSLQQLRWGEERSS